MVQSFRARLPPPDGDGSIPRPPHRWVGCIWTVTPIFPRPPLWEWVCASPSSGLALYAHPPPPPLWEWGWVSCCFPNVFLWCSSRFPYGGFLCFSS